MCGNINLFVLWSNFRLRTGTVSYTHLEQIELWSGKAAPIEAMRQELMNILAGKKEE